MAWSTLHSRLEGCEASVVAVLLVVDSGLAGAVGGAVPAVAAAVAFAPAESFDVSDVTDGAADVGVLGHRHGGAVQPFVVAAVAAFEAVGIAEPLEAMPVEPIRLYELTN